MICNLCPRKCNVDRSKNVGFCGMTEKVKLAKADVFCWEEPVISGETGSGAIFFSGCNLKCCFCQNYKISHEGFGKEISIERLAEIFEKLEQKGVCNINLISPSHYSKQIVEALKIYRPKIPVVWNSNGYEDVETIKMLEPFVDVFLVDLKFFDDELSTKFCKAKNYFNVASKAVLEMVNAKPKIVIENGVLKKGVIVRHLVMPNHTGDSEKILHWIDEHIKDKCLVSLMGQYTPYYKSKDFPEINRKLKPIEYKKIVALAKNLNLNGFVQDLTSSDECFIPIWDLKGV